MQQISERREVRGLIRGDEEATLEEQPSDAGDEPSDDRDGYEPEQVARPERSERQEGDAAQDRHDQGRGDDREEAPFEARRTR